MSHSSQTRLSLVVRLKNAQDHEAWTEFMAIYEPLILRLMVRQGLQESDARDACQQVLQAVARDISQWKPDGNQASFRRWLSRIARNRAVKFLVKERKTPRAAGGSGAQNLLEGQPDAAVSLEEAYEREFQRQLLLRAADQVRPEFRESTWAAFWETCVESRPIAEVAAELGTSVGNVYVARSRVIARLRKKVEAIRDADETS
jgi:RNA polymerase sigma-70 factor (ECF subfamily)